MRVPYSYLSRKSLPCRFGDCGARATLFLATLLIAPVIHAQITGTLTGTALDQSGAVVPQAKITLLNQASRDTRSTTSNAVGYFTFAGVVPGTYAVTVEAAGFKTWRQTDITMDPGDIRKVEGINLQAGTISETVTVEAVAGEVNPVDSGERSSVLTTKDI